MPGLQRNPSSRRVKERSGKVTSSRFEGQATEAGYMQQQGVSVASSPGVGTRVLLAAVPCQGGSWRLLFSESCYGGKKRWLFLLRGLSKWFSSFRTFLARKRTIALKPLGVAIPSAPAALPAKGEPSSGVCLVPVARAVTSPDKCRKINAFSLDLVLGQISHHGSCG